MALVFPGQGSQRNGMAMDFVAEYSEAAACFESASDVLGYDVQALCGADDERLHQTEYTQPCIVTAEIAMLTVLRQYFGLQPEFFGGHSLGEFAALVAAGAMPFATALTLLRERGRLMQDAAPAGGGAMFAITSSTELDFDRVRFLATKSDVDVANENSLCQVVLSG